MSDVPKLRMQTEKSDWRAAISSTYNGGVHEGLVRLFPRSSIRVSGDGAGFGGELSGGVYAADCALLNGCV